MSVHIHTHMYTMAGRWGVLREPRVHDGALCRWRFIPYPQKQVEHLLSVSQTHTHTYIHACIQKLAFGALSLSLPLSVAYTHTHTQTFCFWTYRHYISLSHTHTHTHKPKCVCMLRKEQRCFPDSMHIYNVCVCVLRMPTHIGDYVSVCMYIYIHT